MWSDGSGALDISDSLVSMLVYSSNKEGVTKMAAWKSIRLRAPQDDDKTQHEWLVCSGYTTIQHFVESPKAASLR